MSLPANPAAGLTTEHFNDATTAPERQADATSTGGGGRTPPEQFAEAAGTPGAPPAADLNTQNEATRAALQSDIAKYEPEMHLKPEDKALVREVDASIDNAARQEFRKALTNAPSSARPHDVSPDLDQDESLDLDF